MIKSFFLEQIDIIKQVHILCNEYVNLHYPNLNLEVTSLGVQCPNYEGESYKDLPNCKITSVSIFNIDGDLLKLECIASNVKNYYRITTEYRVIK